MSCDGFDAWLDAGMPAGGAPAAHGHAAACERCTTSLRAAVDLEALLERVPPPVPADFTAAVMARIAAPRPGPAPAKAHVRTLPLWLHAAAQPASVLALLLGALFVWGMDQLPRVALSSHAHVRSVLALAAAHLPAVESPTARTGLEVVVFAAVVAGSWTLYRLTERSVVRAALGWTHAHRA